MSEKPTYEELEQRVWELEQAESECRLAEEALRENENKYRTLIENLPQKIFLKDKNSVYISCNGNYAQDLKIKPDEISGRTDYEFFPKELAEKYRADDKRIMELGKTEELEEKYIQNGQEVWVNTVKVPVKDEKGDLVGIQGIFWDITERKRAEEEREELQAQLAQAQKMESIGTLAGGIAHDFNNLLTTIIGNTEFILADIPKDDPLRADIEEIRAAGERAASLTRQLLAFSRKQVLQPEVMYLNDTTRDMKKMLRRIIREDIKLKTILAPDLGQVEADLGQIEQVIMNLVVNARDAMPEGGKIIIETQNVYLEDTYARDHIAVTPGHYVMLSVSDTGIGMTADVQAQVFDPFFTTKKKGMGTGLGLSTVYGIVKQSKGNIWVYSEPGKGTTFKVYLPRVEKSASGTVQEDKDAKVLTGSETILIVEDDEQVRKLAVRSLKWYGYSTLAASNGEKAIEVAGKHSEPIHLLLTDVVMPGISSKEMVKRLKSSRPEMKVLYMSGYTDNAIIHHEVLDPSTGFLSKPFRREALGRKVRKVLDGEG